MCVFILSAGCQALHNQFSNSVPTKWKGYEHLINARNLMRQQRFKAALVENKLAFSVFPMALRNEAVFQKGLILAHPSNPERNLHEAISCFERLITSKDIAYTISYSEAVILSSIIDSTLAERKNNKMLGAKNSTLEKKNIELRDYIEQSRIEIHTCEEQIDQLKKQIEHFKEIDLKIEKDKIKSLYR